MVVNQLNNRLLINHCASFVFVSAVGNKLEEFLFFLFFFAHFFAQLFAAVYHRHVCQIFSYERSYLETILVDCRNVVVRNKVKRGKNTFAHRHTFTRVSFWTANVSLSVLWFVFCLVNKTIGSH